MSDNDLYVKLILASLFAAGLYFACRFTYRYFVFGRRALSFDWPAGMNSEEAARYAAYYLRWNGWTLSDDIRPGAKVLVRASKDGQKLNLCIPNYGVLPVETQIRDAGIAVRGLGQRITFLTYGVSSDELARISVPDGVMLLEPQQLRDAVRLLRLDFLKSKQDRIAAKNQPVPESEEARQTPAPTDRAMREISKQDSGAGRQYHVIAGLGAWPAPAEAIKRYFRVSEIYPFDLWQCPYYPTLKLLEERFENVLKLDNLEILPASSSRKSTVRCNHYGILHNNDFRRDADGNIVADLASQVEAVRRQVQPAINRFVNELKGKDVLLIRAKLTGHLWFKEDGVPFEVPSRYEQLKRASRLHAAVRQCIQPSRLDIVVLSNLSADTYVPAEGGGILFQQVGDAMGNRNLMYENYCSLFKRLNISLKG